MQCHSRPNGRSHYSYPLQGSIGINYASQAGSYRCGGVAALNGVGAHVLALDAKVDNVSWCDGAADSGYHGGISEAPGDAQGPVAVALEVWTVRTWIGKEDWALALQRVSFILLHRPFEASLQVESESCLLAVSVNLVGRVGRIELEIGRAHV